MFLGSISLEASFTPFHGVLFQRENNESGVITQTLPIFVSVKTTNFPVFEINGKKIESTGNIKYLRVQFDLSLN